MKYSAVVILLCSILLLLFGCTSTNEGPLYSEQEIADGIQGSYELISLSFKAAIENTSDSILPLPTTELFTEQQYAIILKNIDKPGVQKRLDQFTRSLKEDLTAIVKGSVEVQNSWVQSITIEDPYQYILGAKNSLTTLFTPTGKRYLSNYISSKLPEYTNVLTDYQKFLTIINTYIRTYNENNPSDKQEVLTAWDSTHVIEVISSLVFEKMERQEAIIRSLAPSYDSPYIQLYKVQ